MYILCLPFLLTLPFSLLGLAQLPWCIDYLKQVTWHLQSELNSKHDWNNWCFMSVVDAVGAKCKFCWMFETKTRQSGQYDLRLCVYFASRPSCKTIQPLKRKLPNDTMKWEEDYHYGVFSASFMDCQREWTKQWFTNAVIKLCEDVPHVSNLQYQMTGRIKVFIIVNYYHYHYYYWLIPFIIHS